MNVKTVKLTRTYNLGDYESLKVGYEAELTQIEGDDNQKILDATKELEKLCDTYYTMVRFSADKKPEQKQEEKPKPESAVQMNFPEDLRAMLQFEDKADYVKISLKQFLGSENFAKVSTVVRGIGGEYVSAGKGSHFRVPKR